MTQLPDELVVSVRCLVRVQDRVVVCTNLDGLRQVWPGGRRQREESFAETAAREVEEETGSLLSPGSFRLLGWLHIEHLGLLPGDHPYPHTDFCHVLGVAAAVERRNGADVGWTDTEGSEVSSALMARLPCQHRRLPAVPDAERAIDGEPLGQVFLAMLCDQDTGYGNVQVPRLRPPYRVPDEDQGRRYLHGLSATTPILRGTTTPPPHNSCTARTHNPDSVKAPRSSARVL